MTPRKPKRIVAVKANYGSLIYAELPKDTKMGAPVFILRQSDVPALIDQLCMDLALNMSVQTALRRAGITGGRK